MPSMNASTAGLRVLRGILDLDPKTAGGELAKVQPYLTYDEDKKAFDFIRGHLVKFGTLPAPDTLLDQKSVFLPPLTEPYAFEVEQLKNRFIEDAMRTASDAASTLLLDNKAGEALQTLIGALLPITQGFTGAQVTDLRNTNAVELYKQQLAGEAPPGVKLGYPSIDAQGTLESGDMLGIVGRPGSGKTWLMLYTALHRWNEYKEPVMFVTQEMSALQMEKRAISMLANVNPNAIYSGKVHQHEVAGLSSQQYMQELEYAETYLKQSETPFLIYDSKMAGTVADIEAIAALHGIKAVWIDGAYMLRHPDPRLGRYQRVPENLDLMKQWHQRTGTQSVSSWQFKRNAGKDDAAGTPDIDDIGYSHAIPEYMSVIMGLLENPKSLNQMAKKRISILKGRNGEVGAFDIHFNFNTMDFGEVSVAETQTDLTYL